MINFAALLSSTGAAINIAKAVMNAKGEYDQAELKLQMAELASTLADVKLALTEAQDAIRQRDKEIETLKGTFARKDDTVESHGWRFPKMDDGEPYGTPFCPKCLEEDGRLILTRQYGGYREVFCPRCTVKYPNAQTWLSKDELEQRRKSKSDG